MYKKLLPVAFTVSILATLPGCWLGTGAVVGGEAGYIASQEDRTAGQTIDDQVLLASIKSSLIGDPDVGGLSINVDVFKARVTLRGYVKTQQELDRAVELARNTKGVVSVDSRMVVDRK